MKELIAHLELLPGLLAKGTTLERRDVPRGMLDEIEIDPQSGRGEMVFRAVPELPMNETSPKQGARGSQEDAKSSSGQMAGARRDRRKTRCTPEVRQVLRVSAT